MKRSLDTLQAFEPLGSIDALHPMEIDASGSLSPMQKRHKVMRHKTGAEMSLEEIYTFAGWMPSTWLDPSHQTKSKMSSSTAEAKVSAANSSYQTSGLLATSTPLGWGEGGGGGGGGLSNTSGGATSSQIHSIQQSIHMDTGGSTLLQPGADSSSTQEEGEQQQPQQQQQKQKQDDAELIPRSMSDIYKISIQNRNKRDGGGSGVDNDDEDEVEDEKLEDMEDDTPIFSKKGTKDNESDVEFMTRVGWVEQGTEMYGRVKRAEAQSSANGPGGTGGGSSYHNNSRGSDNKRNNGEDGDKEKKQRRRPKQRGKRTSSNESSYDYSQAAGAYGASQHGSDPGRLQHSKTSSGSRNHYDSNRKGRSGGGRGGRSFGSGEDRQRSGGGGGRGGNRRSTTSRR